MTDSKTLFSMMEKNKTKLVDLKFTDVPGTWQHFTIPAPEMSEDTLREGFGFDGSSIRGFQEINESDLTLIPDPSTESMTRSRAQQ